MAFHPGLPAKITVKKCESNQHRTPIRPVCQVRSLILSNLHLLLPAGASIADYYLASEDASGVNSPSRLAVVSMAAGVNAGRLQGVFEFSLNVAQSALGSVGAIYAAGPVSSSGALQEHIYVSSWTLRMSFAGPCLTRPGIAFHTTLIMFRQGFKSVRNLAGDER